MSVSVPDFVEVHENQFVPYDEVTGKQLKRAVELALQGNVPGNYYLRIRKAMTAFRRAGGTDSDIVMDVLCRPASHHRTTTDNDNAVVSGRRAL